MINRNKDRISKPRDPNLNTTFPFGLKRTLNRGAPDIYAANTTVDPMPPPPPPVPLSITSDNSTYTETSGIKQADPDIIVFDQSVDPEFLIEAFFEEFGGTELINISRTDLIDGQDVSYSPIANLSSIRQSFNPNNIISIGAFQENITKYGIDLLARGASRPYFDENGNLVIEIEDVRLDESIELEIATSGTINVIEL